MSSIKIRQPSFFSHRPRQKWRKIMPTYKDEKTNTWYCKFYYTNWQGQKKQKLKRGFARKKDAAEWERKYLEQFAKNPDISFDALYQKYKAYITPRIRESSSSVRFSMLDTHVLPFFKDRIVSTITPADIAAWQSEMLKKNLSESYTRTIDIYLKAIFAYAVEYVGLSKNPCTKSIGSLKNRKIAFWTPEEYKQFSEACKDNLEYFTLFELLYYTGMRVGEALALTLSDIDFNENTISITKTYYRIAGKDLINPPKTAGSERKILIPDFLTAELLEYVEHLYKLAPEDRLFNKRPQYVRAILRDRAKKAGVKTIRVHDLRHSHASMLINIGANPLLVAERLGHESPTITLKTYSHLFPSTQTDIVSKIKKL